MNKPNNLNALQRVTRKRMQKQIVLVAPAILILVSLLSVSLAGTSSMVTEGTGPISRAFETASVPQAKMTMWDLCRALGPSNPTYPCYSEAKVVGRNMLYGFHTGVGHGKQASKDYFVTVGTQHYFLTLDEGRQYSVDRCALAHDSFYWSREVRDSKVNDYNFFRCVEKVDASDSAENEARNLVLTGGVISSGLFPTALGGWRELPSNAVDIPEAKRPTPRVISSAEIKTPRPATTRASAACKHKYAGSFLDPRNGGECWKCPAGFNRVGLSLAKGLPAVDSDSACVTGEIAGIGGTFTSAKLMGKPGCPAGSFEHGVTTVCFTCPSGYKRNPKLVRSLSIDLTKAKDACIAN